MAIQSAIPVSFDAYFPKGAFMVGEVEPVVKWSDDGQRQGQDLDKNSGQPMWQVRVIDADPDARKGQNEVTVKIISVSEPVAPPEIQGLPFRPVVFDGLSVTEAASSKLARSGSAPACVCCRRRLPSDGSPGGALAFRSATVEVPDGESRRQFAPVWGQPRRGRPGVVGTA